MNDIKTLTVYLGSSGHCRQIFKDSTAELGQMIAKAGYHLVYGGMDAGLMGVLAKTALKHGGQVTGIVPQKLKDSERVLKDVQDLIMVDDLWDRKKRMFDMADAVLALPGGFGTMDECLEMLYWAALKLHNKPLILINIDNYWNAFISYLHTLDDFDERYLIVVNAIDDIQSALENWTPIVIPPDLIYHYPHFENEISRRTFEPIVIDIATVENTYYAMCALGLKQLAKHTRAIGFYNKDDQFSALNEWIQTAAKETFITKKCPDLCEINNNRDNLQTALENAKSVQINLHDDKWGEPV